MKWHTPLLVFLSILFLSFSRVPVLAQFDTEVIEEATPNEILVGDLLDPQEVERARQAYFDTVEEYRESEQRYKIARDQYYQINTVASLDEAIRRGKEVLVLRAAAVRTYFVFLELTLESTTGVDIVNKAIALENLKAWQEELRRQETAFVDIDQRAQVDSALNQLNSQQREVLSLTNQVQSLIKLGELQTALDTSNSVAEGISQQLIQAPISAADRAIKQRGLQEARVLQDQAQVEAFQMLQEYQNSSQNYAKSRYDQFLGDVERTYLLLRQIYSYLDEVTKGIE